MNNNNTFLQLRQQTAEDVYLNGDYHTQLRKPLIIENGDELILNKAIIDSSSADSGNIVLEADTEIGFNFNYYVVNHSVDVKYKEYGRTTINTPAEVDGEQYILCQEHTPPVGAYKIIELTNIRYDVVDKGGTGPIFYAGLQYIDAVSGKVMNLKIGMTLEGEFGSPQWWNPTNAITIHARQIDSAPLSEVFKDTSSSDDLFKGHTSKAQRTITTSEILTSRYYPITGTVSVLMSKGNYSPIDFAERFTRLVTLQREGEFTAIKGTSKNPLLLSTSDLIGINTPVFTRVNGGDREFYYGGTSAGGLTSAGTARFVGTNELVLEYDEGSSRFKISQAHFPIYNASGNMEVKFTANQGSTTEFDLTSAHAGIVFASFFSKQGSIDIRLWDNILGFDTHSITSTPSSFVTNTTLGVKVPTYASEFKIASQITTGNRGMDVGVLKTAAVTVPDLTAGFTTEITEIEPIFAGKDFTTSNLTFGYYLISIEGGIQNDLVTNTNIHTNIFSIISRYYQNNNYTTGNSSDAVVYQHVGATQYLNSLRVRVLNSSFVVPDDLGSDNTIFLQHRKATLPAIEDQQKSNKK
jgi:hypothetical protein